MFDKRDILILVIALIGLIVVGFYFFQAGVFLGPEQVDLRIARADANRDGMVDATDMARVQRKTYCQQSDKNYSTCLRYDVNLDSFVDATDLALVQRKIGGNSHNFLFSESGWNRIGLEVSVIDGNVQFDFLYGVLVGFLGMGGDSADRLVVSDSDTLVFMEKDSEGNNHDELFVASYGGESYLLRVEVGDGEVDVEKKTADGWVKVCEGDVIGSNCNIGLVSLNVLGIVYESGGEESVEFSINAGGSFNRLFDSDGNYIIFSNWVFPIDRVFVKVYNENDVVIEIFKMSWSDNEVVIRSVAEQECVDSDSGLDYFSKGNCIDYEGEMVDGCVSGGEHDGWLREVSCDGGCGWSDYDCPGGCDEGVCVEVGECGDGNCSNIRFSLYEGEMNTVSLGGEDYEVLISFISQSEVELEVNEEIIPTLGVGGWYQFSDGVAVLVDDIAFDGSLFSVDLTLGENEESCPGDCVEGLVCVDSDGDGYNISGGDCGLVDCNDTNFEINPGAVEVCDDRVDNDCDGDVDCDDMDCAFNLDCFECGLGHTRVGNTCTATILAVHNGASPFLNDGVISNLGDSWFEVREANFGDEVIVNGATGIVQSKNGQIDCRIYRFFMYFNTSEIPENTWMQNVDLYMYGYVDGTGRVAVQKGVQSDVLTVDDFDAFEGPGYNYYGPVNFVRNAWNTIPFNEQGKADVNTEGITKIVAREANHDYLDVDPISNTFTSMFYTADESSFRPYLVIEYKPNYCGDNICSEGEPCQEDCATEIYCLDGVDNDYDGLMDIEDSDCVGCGGGLAGILEDKEECDDGNIENGDGCSSECEIERQNTVYINDCQDLDQSNTLYILENDIKANESLGTRCLSITANHITLDGNGFMIYGKDENIYYSGIYANDVGDVIVKNISVWDCGNGIYFYKADDSLIYNSKTISNLVQGISVYQSDNFRIFNNIASKNRGYAGIGSYIAAPASGKIMDNILCANNNYDIHCFGSVDVAFSGNIFDSITVGCPEGDYGGGCSQIFCGNGNCDVGEDCASCRMDCGEVREVDCSNGVDDDCDNIIDCDDEDCVEDPYCKCGDGTCDYGEVCVLDCSSETHCYDGVDNDENGQIDCDDSRCYCCSLLVYGGDSDQKLDLLFIGDEYPSVELFENAVWGALDFGEAMDASFMDTEPFKYNKDKFNVWVVPSIFYLNLNCNGGWCYFDDSIINEIALDCPQADIINVISRKRFRSYAWFSGRTYNSFCLNWWDDQGTVCSGDPIVHIDYSRLLLHEFGHAFGQLADEYVEPPIGDLPREPNCAPDIQTAQQWWGDLEGVEGVNYYNGCSYVNDNIKPTQTSIMEAQWLLDYDYMPVNERRLEERLGEYS